MAFTVCGLPRFCAFILMTKHNTRDHNYATQALIITLEKLFKVNHVANRQTMIVILRELFLERFIQLVIIVEIRIAAPKYDSACL
jgi:hypothetical protein